MNLRFAALDKKMKELPKGTETPIIAFDDTYIKKDAITYYFLATQILLDTLNFPLNLSCLDSIYSSLLFKAKYPVKYQLFYTDSINTVIETAGDKITAGFETETVPVVNGRKVQAIVKITPPAVIRNMISVLILSALMILLIIACLLYEFKIYQNEKYLALLKENFTNALTHDLKTPLSSIHSVLMQLNNNSLDGRPEVKSKFTEIAIEQTLNLQAVINQILTVAYLEKKKITFNKEPVDLPHIIQTLIDKFSVKDGKPVKFHADYDLKDAMIEADVLHLTNAISNLIDNAVKYSGDSVQIEFVCKTVNEQVHIKIKDNGFGIPKNDQPKIFDRFDRGAEIKRNSISGFGLGLNYVRQVIEAHGGAVALSSKEGEGSEFTITLPVEINTF
ncbi:MAG: HAMP domain-containing histidine kinase [Tannerella sp.]|nr:HAMP domain-containing histidine kinase [Tannerella sp.]